MNIKNLQKKIAAINFTMLALSGANFPKEQNLKMEEYSPKKGNISNLHRKLASTRSRIVPERKITPEDIEECINKSKYTLPNSYVNQPEIKEIVLYDINGNEIKKYKVN